MALGDLMASRISQSSLAVVSSNHVDDCTSNHDDDGDLVSLRRDSDAASSSYGNAAISTATTMVYLPQTIVFCELRHDAFEACLPAGPSDSGLVSKWRPKDRVSHLLFPYHETFLLFPFSEHFIVCNDWMHGRPFPFSLSGCH